MTMTDNVVQLTFDLHQTEAELAKAHQSIAKLKDEVKKYKDETKKANEEGSKGYEKQAAALRTNAQAIDQGTSALRRMGGALNQIGGQGTGQVAQLAGAIGMLTGPVGIAAAAVGGLTLIWEGYSNDMKEAKERTDRLKDSITALNQGAAKDSAKTGKGAADKAEENARLGLTYSDPEKLSKDIAKNYGMTEKQATGIMGTLAPKLQRVSPEKRNEILGNLLNTVQVARVGGGLDPEETAKRLSEDGSSSFGRAKSGNYYGAASRLLRDAGFKINEKDLENRYQSNKKAPAMAAMLAARSLAAEPETTASDLGAFVEESQIGAFKNQWRGGGAAVSAIEEQQKKIRATEKEARGAWFKTRAQNRVNQERSQLTTLMQSEAEVLRAQNPEKSWSDVYGVLLRIAEAAERNALGVEGQGK